MRPINYPDFSYITDKYSCFNVENAICDRCGIGYSHSSDLPQTVKEHYSARAYIYASEGKASFHIIVTRLNNGKYEISVSGLTASR